MGKRQRRGALPTDLGVVEEIEAEEGEEKEEKEENLFS